MTEFNGIPINEAELTSDLFGFWATAIILFGILCYSFIKLIWDKTEKHRAKQREAHLRGRSDKYARLELRRMNRVRHCKSGDNKKKERSSPIFKILPGVICAVLLIICICGAVPINIDLAKKYYAVYTGKFKVKESIVSHRTDRIILPDGTKVYASNAYYFGIDHNNTEGTLVFAKRSGILLGYESN